MAKKPRKDVSQMTGERAQSATSGGVAARHVTEIPVREAAARMRKGWLQLREMLVIPDFDREESAPYTTTTGALFDFIGERIQAALSAGRTEAALPWIEAAAVVHEKTGGLSLDDNHFSQEISRWRRGQ